jgi:hypothetical protein
MKALTLTGVLIAAYAGGCSAAERPLETRLVWSPRCLGETDAGTSNRSIFLGAVVAAVAPKLIGGAIDAAATALKKAGEKAETARSQVNTLSRPYAVSKDSDLGISPEHGCLVIARAEFPAQAPASENGSGLNQLDGMKGYVYVFEAKVKMLTGESYFQLVPYRLRVGKFEGSSFWSPGSRDYTVALTLAAPGADKPFASTTFNFVSISEDTNLEPGSWQLSGLATAPLALPPVPDSGKKAQAKQEAFLAPYVLATQYILQSIRPTTTKPSMPSDPFKETDVVAVTDNLCAKVIEYNKTFPKAPMSDDRCAYRIKLAGAAVDEKVDTYKTFGKQLGWAKAICPGSSVVNDDLSPSCLPGTRPVDPAARFGYMTTTVTVVETRPGNKFAAYLGEALGAAKDDLTKAVAAQVIPAQVQAASDAADAASRTARRGVVLADLAVTQAQQALAELQATTPAPKESDVTAARVALIKAKVQANDAYRLAGDPAPFPELD